MGKSAKFTRGVAKKQYKTQRILCHVIVTMLSHSSQAMAHRNAKAQSTLKTIKKKVEPVPKSQGYAIHHLVS